MNDVEKLTAVASYLTNKSKEYALRVGVGVVPYMISLKCDQNGRILPTKVQCIPDGNFSRALIDNIDSETSFVGYVTEGSVADNDDALVVLVGSKEDTVLVSLPIIRDSDDRICGFKEDKTSVHVVDRDSLF